MRACCRTSMLRLLFTTIAGLPSPPPAPPPSPLAPGGVLALSTMEDLEAAANTVYNVSYNDSASSFVFDGSSSYALIPRPVEDDFTIVLEIRSSTPCTTGASQTTWYIGCGVIDGEKPSAVLDYGLYLIDHRLAFAAKDADSAVSTSDLTDGAWHTVIATRVMSTGELTVHIDGVLEGSYTSSTANQALTAPSELKIGNSVYDNFFTGELRNIRFFGEALGLGAAPSPPPPALPPPPSYPRQAEAGDDPVFVGADGVPFEVRGQPGMSFNLFSSRSLSVNAAFEEVPARFRALDITDTVLGSVSLAACSSGRRWGVLIDVTSGNVSVSGAAPPAGAVSTERYQCDLRDMTCRWVATPPLRAGLGGDALVLPLVDSGFSRLRVGGERAAVTVTRHCMLSLDGEVDCAHFAEWPHAAEACAQLSAGVAPAARREEWTMLLSLPRLRTDQRFFFVGLDVSRVADAQSQVHGLLGQRAVVGGGVQDRQASVIGHRGATTPGFGPQGEGAIEGSYLDYAVALLEQHDGPSASRYNRFLGCTHTADPVEV